jgi:hypothetical protein
MDLTVTSVVLLLCVCIGPTQSKVLYSFPPFFRLFLLWGSNKGRIHHLAAAAAAAVHNPKADADANPKEKRIKDEEFI